MESLVAQIDYSKVEPIPFKKTVAYVNHFVIQTTQFLNRFSFLCEQRLDQVSRHLQRYHAPPLPLLFPPPLPSPLTRLTA
jgi:WASH complex subunit CCDC53